MKIFAYGSNMCFTRLVERVPSSRFIATAALPGYQLKVHKKSTDGSVKASVEKTNDLNDVVYGVVFDIDNLEKGELDRAEGLNKGYNEENVTVQLVSGETEDVLMYYADNSAIDNNELPYSWYMDYIIVGAEDYLLPKKYVEFINQLPTKLDADERRRQDHISRLARHKSRRV